MLVRVLVSLYRKAAFILYNVKPFERRDNFITEKRKFITEKRKSLTCF